MSDQEDESPSEQRFAALDQLTSKLSPRRAPSTVAGPKSLPPDDPVVSEAVNSDRAALDSSQPQQQHEAPRRTRRAYSTSSNPGITERNRVVDDSMSATSLLAVTDRRPSQLAAEQAINTGGLDTYWIDHGLRHDERPPEHRTTFRGAFRRNVVGQFFVEYVNLGVVGMLLCLVCLLIGLICRLVPGLSHDVHSGVGRYFLSAGIFGFASALSNLIAVRVLLLAMFLSRHESVVQTSVKQIVMGVFFSDHRVESEVVAHVQKTLSTVSWAHVIQNAVTSDECSPLVDKFIDRFFRTQEGVLLGMMGVSRERIKGLVVPAVLTVVSEVSPVMADKLQFRDVVTSEALFDIVERVVSHRAEGLGIADLKAIVSSVLSPHLAILVLWGSVFGIFVGLLAEVFTLSRFLSGC